MSPQTTFNKSTTLLCTLSDNSQPPSILSHRTASLIRYSTPASTFRPIALSGEDMPSDRSVDYIRPGDRGPFRRLFGPDKFSPEAQPVLDILSELLRRRNVSTQTRSMLEPPPTSSGTNNKQPRFEIEVPSQFGDAEVRSKFSFIATDDYVTSDPFEVAGDALKKAAYMDDPEDAKAAFIDEFKAQGWEYIPAQPHKL